MYVEKFDTPVTEVGFVIPDWCPFVGVSPDGFVGEGCIEIKAPCKMYDTPKPEHYAQMQMQMAVCEKPWCDYVVYVEGTGELKITSIHYDHYYWENTLYRLIRDGLEIILQTCISDLVAD